MASPEAAAAQAAAAAATSPSSSTTPSPATLGALGQQAFTAVLGVGAPSSTPPSYGAPSYEAPPQYRD
jgi:hypothetical protein